MARIPSMSARYFRAGIAARAAGPVSGMGVTGPAPPPQALGRLQL
jgi:hypothetical protein